jgi:precorrin-2 dehydrogenase / sirohydrochlorin ferrochelatase
MSSMSTIRPYPVFFDLTDQPVLIVGGGAVGLRKARGLADGGARVTVVSPAFVDGWASISAFVSRLTEPYQPHHMHTTRWRFVFAATDVPAVNEAVARDAAAAGILCCRCDAPHAGDFFGGAVWQQDGLTVAVSTAASSPALGARVRDAIEASLDPLYAQWTQLFAQWRPRVLREVTSPLERQTLLRRLAGDEMEKILRHEGRQGGQAFFETALAQALIASSTEVSPHAP